MEMQATSLQGFPLSAQQSHLWSWQGNNQVYCTLCALQIQGMWDRERFKQAVEQVIARHEILRTVFYPLPGMDLPVQVISDRALWSYAEISLEHLATPEQQRDVIDTLFAAMKAEPYDLRHGPLLRVRLFHIEISRQIVLVSLPALSADSPSVKLFVEEVLQTYIDHNTPVEEVLQYADVSAWQEEQLLGEKALSQQEYWRKTAFSQIIGMKLPFQASAAQARGTFVPHVVEIEIPERLAQRMEVQAQQHAVSALAWLLACWNVLLWRLSEDTTFLIGVACDGRTYEDLDKALGPYTHFIPVEAQFEQDRSFALALALINASLQEALKRQLSFIWEAVSGQVKDDATSHFFPVVFAYERWPETFEAGALTFSLLKHWSYTEPFALKLSALQVGTRLQLSLHYDPQQMTTAQIGSLARLFRTVLEQVTEQPQILVGMLSLFSTEERACLLTTFRGPHRIWPESGFHQRFEEQVQRQPNALAVISRQEQLTYQQLNIRANQLAQVLRRRGVGPNVVVGLCLSRQASMLVGLLGILKAGGAYLPLDVGSPKARLRFQLQESGARLLLTQEEQREHLPGWVGEIVSLEELAGELAESSPEDQRAESLGEQLAYVIYTSGSTGTPKGVMVSQRNLVNYALALCEQLGAEPGWQYATVSTLAADLGNTAIFGALVSGGCVQVLDYEQVTSAEAMAVWAERHPIDVLKIVPSHLSALLESERGRAFLPCQALVLGGEALPESLLDRISELGGACVVYNHYGPTETTIGVLVNALGVLRRREEERDEERTIALGRPLANLQAYVLDERMQIVPAGVKGELYIGGEGVAWGYVGQGELTATRFVPDPYGGEEGARLYRTGDLACYEQGGPIEFLGRVDGQVKVRGYRVEVGEIEAALRQHPQVRESVVVLRGDGGEPQLVGYVVSRQRVQITSEQLEAFVRERLPAYMVPLEYVHLEEWPLTANGKVDRQRLRMLDLGTGRVKRAVLEARSPLEELILQVWRELLGSAEIGIDESFFAVGGHSLLATRMMARIRGMLQVELPVRAVFEASTVAGLALLVEQALREGEGIQIPPLVVRSRPEEIPLSYAQQRLWFLDQLEPESLAYLASRARRMRGLLDAQSLERSLQELVRRHESLRTTFIVRAGHLVQVIHSTGRTLLPVIDLQGLRPEQKASETHRLVSQEAQRPCDLAQGPLLRTYLLRVERQEHIILLTLHHIITDGWSNEVLVREIATLYQAFASGQPSPLAPLPIQYADYALWQRAWLQGEILETQLAYWKKQLADIPSLDLPTDYPRLARQTYQGAVLSMELPEELSQRLVALSQQEGVTVFMLLLTAFQVLLMRYTGKTDISVGTSIANRTRAEIEGLIGFFVNMLVIRTDCSGNPTFLQVLQQVREVCLQAYTHQDLPFEKLVSALQPERDLSRSPLFQVSFQLTQATLPTQLMPGLSLEALGIDGASADDDLRVMMTETPQGFSCTAFYNTTLFEAQTIHRILKHFQTLLQGIVLTPEVSVALLPLLSEQEQQMQLVEWNMTQARYPENMCVHQLFEQQVQRTPDALALMFGEEALTYSELNRRANHLANYLQGLGVGPEVLVGIYLERGIEMVIGLLAVLKAGGAYVPLDPTYPQKRLAFMAQDAGISLLLTQEHSLGRSPDNGCMIVCLDRDREIIARQSSLSPELRETAEQLAYVLYTSGSTGQPKGVMVPHRGLVNYLHWARQAYTLSGGHGAPLHSSIGFDLTVTSLFVPLLTGQPVLLLPESQGVASLAIALASKNTFNVVKVTPSHLEALTGAIAAEQLDGAARVVIIGGEALGYERLTFWQNAAAEIRLINEYGPTETVVGCCIYEVPKGTRLRGAVPIGRPIANMQIYLLDTHLQPVPVGVAAELYVGGVGVTRGYLHRPDLTAERFIPHPWSQEPGGRLYQTGDLACYRTDGTLEYLGRLDQQVKIRGHRIELGEIEVTLGAHPAVQEAVVIMREDWSDDARLVAYAVLDLPEETSRDGQSSLTAGQSSLTAGQSSLTAGQSSLAAGRIEHWQRLYDEIYQRGTSQAVQTFNLVGWDSSYTGQPLAIEEMQAWQEDTLALVRSYHPRCIWEIGCGTGLLLFPLSLAGIRYYGTDFSSAVLTNLRQQLAYLREEQGVQPEVTLLQRQADDFSALPEAQIDTVLINSVIQYFPNLDYLLRVLEGAVRLVAPGGRIIVGDVRSLPLLETFHADVQLYRAPDTLTRQQLWQQVQLQLQQEEELVLDPAFFRRWAQTTGRVYRVEVQLKRGRHHNELTQFRYQVVLHVGEPPTARRTDWQDMEEEKLNWSEQMLTRELLRQKLMSEQPPRLRLRQVPNARLDQAIQTLRWIKGQAGAETAGQWRAELQTRACVGVEPEDLWEDAEQLGYQMTTSWGQHADDGRYDVLLQRESSELWDDAEEELLPQAKPNEPAVNWQSYANQPLRREAEHLLVPQIRQYLRERLPDYMLPTSLVVLKALPLTLNGKIDRRALPLPTAVQSNDRKTFVAPRTLLEGQLVQMWQEVLHVEQIGAKDSFFDLGGDSIKAAIFINRLQDLLGIMLYVVTIFDYHTISSLADYLTTKHPDVIERTFGPDAHDIQESILTRIEHLPREAGQEFPLSFAQQRLWFLDQLTPNSTTYLSSELLRFRGILDSRALERSIQEIVHRHENLRTTFLVRTEHPVQVIHPVSQFSLPIIDLSNLRLEQRMGKAKALAHQEAKRPCDLARGPLFRTYLLRIAGQEHLMVLSLHHIITDGWSNEVLVRELSTLYRSYLVGQPSPLTPLPIQYADYAQWQRQWLQDEVLQKHITYWQQQLQGASPIKLPIDAARMASQHDSGARYAFTLSTDLSAQLVALSRREGVTLFMALLAAFQVLLYRLSGQPDIVVGTDVANRMRSEIEGLIGFFVNLLPLRTNLQDSPRFSRVMQQVQGMVLGAYAHQELPFELIVEHGQMGRKEQQAPLVSVLCVMQNIPRSSSILPGIETETIDLEDAMARFDLALFLQEEAHAIKGSVVYRAELFRELTIATWMCQFEVLLNSIVQQPDIAIDMLEISTDEQKAERAKKKAAKGSLDAKRIRSTKSQGFEIQ